MSFSKNINSLKIGIAISTYSEEKTDQSRYAIIEKSLHSLQNILKTCPLNVYVVLVVDGPIPQKHTQILNKFDFQTVYKKYIGYHIVVMSDIIEEFYNIIDKNKAKKRLKGLLSDKDLGLIRSRNSRDKKNNSAPSNIALMNNIKKEVPPQVY